jgi:phospholipid/cholesterol/gamma-HCH transport system ATP-binding protein
VASPVIELRNVSLSFDGQPVIKDANLKIQKGEKIVLIGPSGHGKSVILKLMAGVLTPTSGEVIVADSSKGMLFQKNALFDSLNATDNIAFPLRETTSLDETTIAQKVQHYLQAVGLSHAAQLFPDEISGGMQKRLGIARALALDPEIIFYDDPTAGLDPITSRKIIELILQLQKENGSTVVAITNDMNRAWQMADRLAMVIDGELVVTGNVEETRRHQDARVQQFIKGLLQGPLTQVG